MSGEFVFPALKFLEPIGCITKSKPHRKEVDSTAMPFRAPSLFAENYARTTTELKVCQCELEELPELVGAFYLLLELDLSDNKLEILPPDIGSCYSLKVLNFSSNHISVIPEEVQMLAHLEKLLGYTNKLTAIPDWIGTLELTELNLFNNKVLHLPVGEQGLGDLRQVEELNLAANVMMQLPDEAMSSWLNMRVLNLYDCRLIKVGSFAHLVNLEELRIFGNNLAEAPDLGSGLSKLKILEMNKNQIAGDLPLSFFAGLNALERIVLNSNQITALPVGINCPSLESLLISNNALKELPPDLPLNRSLKIIFLNSNALESLPQTFMQNTWLERVNLSRNVKCVQSAGHILAHLKTTCAANGGKYWAPEEL